MSPLRTVTVSVCLVLAETFTWPLLSGALTFPRLLGSPPCNDAPHASSPGLQRGAASGLRSGAGHPSRQCALHCSSKRCILWFSRGSHCSDELSAFTEFSHWHACSSETLNPFNPLFSMSTSLCVGFTSSTCLGAILVAELQTPPRAFPWALDPVF